MTRRTGLNSRWVAYGLSLAALAACGGSTTAEDDDSSGGSGTGQGGTGVPTGGTATGGSTSGASGTGAQPVTGGVGGANATGGAAGTGVSGTGAGLGGSLTGGAGPGGMAGSGVVSGAGGIGGGMAGTGVGAAGMGGRAMGGAGGTGSAGKGGSGGSGGSATCPLRPTGWAAVPGLGFNAPTSGGCNATPVTATSLATLNTALAGFSNKVVRVQGTITGTINVTANTTLEGLAGSQIHGSLVMDGAINVIIRNLTIVGNNCVDNSDCQNGADAVSINGGAHHVWVDHCDISNGSDGNLDVTDASDFVTVSWTKFSYSGTGRDHRFSNLVGDTDGTSGAADAGHLGVTFDHCWWADRAQERMPRVRYGRVHVYNSLYTSTGNNHCVALGYNGNIRLENNVFVGVADPVNSTDYTPNTGAVTSTGNVYTSTSGATANRGTAWVPSSITGYTYTLGATSGLQAAIQAGARPQP